MTTRLLPAPVTVLGYGHQGEAQALNLRDSGLEVVVGARPGHGAWERARAAGFDTRDLADAAALGRTVAVLLPDEVAPQVWAALAARLAPDATLVFAHGYNLLAGSLAFAAEQDVVLVSPCGPGQVLRQEYLAGAGLPAYLAVHQQGSGSGWERAEAYAHAIGSGRARLLRTTVREETEVDLFGEQVVLCGGMNALVTVAWETLVARGYSAELAYLEVVHQLRFVADLLQQRGIAGLREGISSTALYGDLTRGPRVIGPETRRAMEAILGEIRDGSFQRELAAETAAGRPVTAARLAAGRAHPIEAARRRALGLPES
jgi:ketol-acid reductoisomerase